MIEQVEVYILFDLCVFVSQINGGIGKIVIIYGCFDFVLKKILIVWVGLRSILECYGV